MNYTAPESKNFNSSKLIVQRMGYFFNLKVKKLGRRDTFHIGSRNRFPLLLVSLCIFHQNALPVSVAQKTKTTTSIAFKGNGAIKGPSRAIVTTGSQWIQESLNTHNFFRSLHGSPPLRLNDTLSEISQYYANHLLQVSLKNLDKNGQGSIYFEHNPELGGRTEIGENLFYIQTTSLNEPIPSPYAVLLWYEEIKDYDFSTADRKPTSNPKNPVGHLTALLWRSTSQMGTAYAARKLPNGETLVFVVANYFRQGNVFYPGNDRRLYFQNVLPFNFSKQSINEVIVSKCAETWWTKRPEPASNTAWRDSALKIHNRYRSIHGSRPLSLNKDLCKVSQLWANHLLKRGPQYFSHYGVLEPNFLGVSRCNFGEISMHFVTEDEELSAEYILKSWYSQSRSYDFSKSQKSNQNVKTDAFEQIVWNSTTEFCMSYAREKAENGQYHTYVVANYYPSLINTKEDRKRNVFSSVSKAVGNIDLIICVSAVMIFNLVIFTIKI